jgi:hypothetical protein
MSDSGRIEEQVEVVIAQTTLPEPGGAGAAAPGELAAIRRRLEFDRFLLGVILAIVAVCLALLIVVAGRGL